MKIVIRADRPVHINLAELLTFKDLVWNLAKRDILIRYKQTVMGVLWAVIRPLVNIVIFGFLSQLIEHNQNIAEKLVTVSAGIIIWGLISSCINETSNSILNNSAILSKVYFPKLVLPISSMAVCLVDFFISLLILILLKLFFIGMPGIEFLILLPVIFYALFFSLAVGLWFAALNVKYRDIKFIIPFLLQVGFYLCPVFLSISFYTSKLPGWLAHIFMASPLTGIIELFKYSFLGIPLQLPLLDMLFGIVFTILLFAFSLRYFVKFEKTFADYI